MATELIASHRETAEIYNGQPLCKEKSRQLLADMNLPIGLLPLDELTEVGQNKTTGFMWLKQKKKVEHKFRKIGRTVTYDTEVTAFVEDRKMKRLTGVKTKEFMLWISISDIYILEEQSDEKITFGTSSGMSRCFPVSAFELDHHDYKK